MPYGERGKCIDDGTPDSRRRSRPTALGADLRLLTAAPFDPAGDCTSDVAQAVLVFTANARLAVASFLGMSLTITEYADDVPDRVVLQFTLLEDHVHPGDIATSLRLPGPTEAGGDQLNIEVVLYAAAPGAFVDIAADLAFLTGRELNTADLDQHLGLAGEPDITGVLQAEAVISEAIAVLIAGGRTRERASTELDTLADAAHTDRITEATAILTALTTDASGASVT